jgi:fructosamine-3-kinase
LTSLVDDLARALGLDAARARRTAAGGGCIADSFILDDGRRRMFVKSMPRRSADALDAERDGLQRLAAAGEIRVPTVLGAGASGDTAWLALECLDLGRADRDAMAALGAALARLHAHTADRHGLEIDNFIGATPQRNTRDADWTGFLFDCRIGDQIERLSRQLAGFDAELTARLRAAWTRAFGDYAPPPSLLHGDLWIGNAGALTDGTPVVFDPAVHYGDRECDLAMAALFGGFGAGFFDAYADSWPLEPGWQRRREFYQLYHVLNHANLFGGGYVDDSLNRISRLLGR